MIKLMINARGSGAAHSPAVDPNYALAYAGLAFDIFFVPFVSFCLKKVSSFSAFAALFSNENREACGQRCMCR
jgi:hypothetical protein